MNTLGEYLQFVSDQKNYWNVFAAGKNCKTEYNAFIEAILTYVNAKMSGKDFVLKTLKSATKTTVSKEDAEKEKAKRFENEDEMYAYFDTLPSTDFEKGSKSAKRISKMAAECFDAVSTNYLSSGCAESEVEEYISEAGVKYREYIDKRRKENEVRAAASRIRTKIDDIVDYKFDASKQKQRETGIKHAHNPFVNDREL